MSLERLFLDTVFIQASLNRRDHYHTEALRLFPLVQDAAEVWVTEAILVEVGNALSSMNRPLAAQFIRQCYKTPNLQVIPISPDLFQRALELYQVRPDKS